MLSINDCEEEIEVVTNHRRLRKISECINCKQNKPITARRLCENCYARIKRAGKLEEFPLIPQNKIALCHPDRKHFGHGLCNSCYKRSMKLDPVKVARIAELTKKRKPSVLANFKRTLREFLASDGYSEPTKAEINNLVDGKNCSYCRKRPATAVDHIVPLCRGGLPILSNLTGVCIKCNGSKGSKLLSEWDGYDVKHNFIPDGPSLDGIPINEEENTDYVSEALPTLLSIGLYDALKEVESVLAWNQTEKHPGAKWKSKSIDWHDSKAVSHLSKAQNESLKDDETGRSHRAHACCRLLMSLAHELETEQRHTTKQ